MGGNVDDGLDVGLDAAVGTEILVGTGASVGVTSSPAAIGVGPACPPPQPTANKIDAIPAISRPTLNNFISYPQGCANPQLLLPTSDLDVSCPLIFFDLTQQEFHVFGVRGLLQLE